MVQQIVGQFTESLLPYLMYKRSKHQIKHKFSSNDLEQAGIVSLNEDFHVEEQVLLQARIEASKPTYEVSAAFEISVSIL